MSHIQNTAPGPPMAMAVATPAILPVPIRPDSAIAKAWNDETPLVEEPPPNSSFTMSFKYLTCKNPVANEKYTPTPIHSTTSASLHTTSLTSLINCSKRCCCRYGCFYHCLKRLANHSRAAK